jgi:hypothetical protein
MMNKGIFAVALGGMLISSAAFAQTAAPATPAATTPAATTPAPQDAAPADDPNEVICHAGEPIVGSRFPGPRTCHTRKEWAQIQQDSQRALYQQQMERSSPGGK